MGRFGPSIIGMATIVLLAGVADAGAKPKKILMDKYGGKTLYLQHNLAYESGGADWCNFIETGKFVPVGTPVVLKNVTGDEIVLETEAGKSIEIDCDDIRPSMQVVADRILGTTPPNTDDLTDTERVALGRAQVVPGMSRRVVFMSIGYPPFYKESMRIVRKMIANTDLMAEELIWVKNDYTLLIVNFENDTVVSVETVDD